MSDLSVFVFESQEVCFVGTLEKPEWIAADVSTILEIKNVSDALANFDGDERGIANIYTPGDDNPQGQEMLNVTEPGLYRLIFKSRKPVAKCFQRWVFHEVLPSLIFSISFRISAKKGADDLTTLSSLPSCL